MIPTAGSPKRTIIRPARRATRSTPATKSSTPASTPRPTDRRALLGRLQRRQQAAGVQLGRHLDRHGRRDRAGHHRRHLQRRRRPNLATRTRITAVDAGRRLGTRLSRATSEQVDPHKRKWVVSNGSGMRLRGAGQRVSIARRRPLAARAARSRLIASGMRWAVMAPYPITTPASPAPMVNWERGLSSTPA